ncbi:MAG: histidine--tRNA ligase [bacterium]|nr:histidine--tRNA ligase [bacterium]
MHDILPGEMHWHERVSSVARRVSEFYNFQKVESPIVEFAALFERGVGEDTDVVQKEMYTLTTKGGDRLALRPEGTASAARLYAEHALSRVSPIQKLYYEGPMFRHENTQSGRSRGFHQIGFEVIGSPNDPIYDAQVIIVMTRTLEELKLKRVVLKINSIGCRICRPIYKRMLQNYYKNRLKDLCADCERRYKTNPLRLLDCKRPECAEHKKNAPNFFDKLCVTCSHHLKTVLEYLDEVQISYSLDHELVRGLDYYSRTVFEFFIEGADGVLGDAIASGGRYDYLMELLGGRPTPGVGCAMGVERIVDAMKAQEIKLSQRPSKKVFIVHVGDLAKKKIIGLIEVLRNASIPTGESLSRDSIKAQLKAANKEGSPLALIVGQKEIFEESVIIRDLKSGLQETIPTKRMVEEIKKRLK